MIDTVWIFNGDKNMFPSAIFSTKEKALVWIRTNKLTGTLTKYPIDIAIYDWAIENKFFEPKNEFQKNARSIANYSSAHLEHYHFEDGFSDK